MKKILAGFLVVSILAGCSTTPPPKLESVVKDDLKKEKQYEDEYITHAIETKNTINETADGLKQLLVDMNVSDAGWRIDVDTALLKLQMAANDYTMYETNLTDEQMETKFKETSNNFAQGVEELHSIYSDGKDALKTEDKRIFEALTPRLDHATALINKGYEQLEIERYKE